MCMHMSAYVCVCEHMCLLICMWWCRFGVDDGFGIMVLSGCSTYVTESVDAVLVVTGCVMYVYGVVVVVVLGGIMYVTVDGSG